MKKNSINILKYPFYIGDDKLTPFLELNSSHYNKIDKYKLVVFFIKYVQT